MRTASNEANYYNVSNEPSIERRMNKAGWYVIYSSVRWNSCQPSWYHRIYVDEALVTNGSDSACRNNSYLVVVSFLNGTVRVGASVDDVHRRSRIALLRIG